MSIKRHCLITFGGDTKRFFNCFNNARRSIWRLSQAAPDKNGVGNDIAFRSSYDIEMHIEQLGSNYHPLIIPARYVRCNITPPLKAKQKSLGNKIDTTITIANDDHNTDSTIQVHKTIALATNIRRKREKNGLNPDEESSHIELITYSPADEKKDSLKSRSPVQQILRTPAVKNYLSMLNQQNIYRWELPTKTDIKILLSAISEINQKNEKSKYCPEKLTSTEFVAFISLMFWAAKTPEQLISFRLYHNVDSISRKTPKPGLLLAPNHTLRLVIIPATPERAVIPDDQQKQSALKIVNFYCLKIPVVTETYLKRYIQNRCKKSSRVLFSQPPEKYIEELEAFIQKTKKYRFSHLTVNKISTFLHTKVAEHPRADNVTAMYITGNKDFLGYNRSFYTAIPINKLKTIYSKTCLDIIAGQQKTYSSDTATTLQDNDVCVGSPFVPKRQTVKKLVTALKAGVKKTTKETYTRNLPLAHYYMLRYTSFMVAFATGFRAVREPIILPAEYDTKTGFAVISDKDSDDNYKTRIVWLPHVCRQQLAFFWQHATRTFPKIIDYDKQAIKIQTQRNRHFSVQSVQFLDQNNKIRTVGPTTLAKSIQYIFPLPVNASRHYLRTNLLDRNCPVDIINAFLDHWERGEEPWGRFSGLSPTEYAATLSKYLTPLLLEDGWVALAGWRI